MACVAPLVLKHVRQLAPSPWREPPRGIPASFVTCAGRRTEKWHTVTTIDPLASPRAPLARAGRRRDAPTEGASAARPYSAGAAVEGKIEVSARAIATIAARAATECYGVASLAPRYAGFHLVERLAPERAARGVEARFVDDHVVIDLWVVLEGGLRVIEVAHMIMVSVKYAVEEALGLRVARVNVNIQALRVSPL